MKKVTVPVFFTVDETYAPYLSTALASLIDNTSEKYDYDVNVIYHNLTRRSMRKLEKLNKGKESYVNLIFTEMQETLEGISDRKETRLKADCFTPTIYYRIFLPEMFPQYDKGIYLDSDIIVRTDIAELFNVDLAGNIMAACTDMSTQSNKLFCKYFDDAVGIPHKKYFNSGVLLMDFKKFRDEEFCEHFFYLLNKYDFDTVAPDQDYLNALCNGRVKYLGYEWNTMPSNGFTHIDEPKIVHYNLFFKPWHYDGTEYEEYYWKYAKRSAFIKEIEREKRSFTKKKVRGDEERLKLMSERVEEILKGEITFKKIFDSGKETRS
ncbi:MAG: glycosyltransferase family 8 protein [Candidatus Saccharibacteria bacterium]|nr:glycosyltransferase family 8 protein [Candidatus Saccharibacteria bacterium]